MEVEGTVRTRRAVLVGAAGGVAAAVAHALGRPAPAWAVSDPLMTEVLNNTTAQTGIASAQTTPSSAVFAAYSQGNARVYALFGQASGPGAFGAYAYHETTGVAIGARSTDGIGVVGAVGGTDPDRPMERIGVFGSGPDCGVYGSGAKGVYGTGSDTGVGVYGVADAVGAIGTEGSSLEGRGVRGSTGVGIGVEAFAESPDGKALRVAGKARFTRSGRATVLKNKSSVDVDLRARGGLSSSSLCFATLATSRTGAWVRTVRPNYPSTGYMRIYLNKVASTTSSTYVSWIVFENS